MTRISRRSFIALSAAVGAARLIPQVGTHLARRRVLRLVYDKRLGMMRAIDRIVP